MPGHFDPRSLLRLGRELHKPSSRLEEEVVLVQYVPHSFGFKAMNLPFCLWLYALSRTRRRILVMFHEATVPLRRRQPLQHQILASVTILMAMLAAKAANVVFISTPAWKDRLIRFTGGRRIEWLPVPSNVSVAPDAEDAFAMRQSLKSDTIIGHFGGYDNSISYSLKHLFPRLLERSAVSILLIGRDTIALRNSIIQGSPHLASRVFATGGLPEKSISIALSSCDLMVQPYPDGVSTRRGSTMAGLAHQRAIVTTAGAFTEPIWFDSGAVALVPAGDDDALLGEVSRLASDESGRSRIASAGIRLYDERFALRHTIKALRAAASEL